MILDGYQRSLECLVLDDPHYRVDQSGSGDAELHPTAFKGLTIALKTVSGD